MSIFYLGYSGILDHLGTGLSVACSGCNRKAYTMQLSPNYGGPSSNNDRAGSTATGHETDISMGSTELPLEGNGFGNHLDFIFSPSF